jgi:hypothetical protein
MRVVFFAKPLFIVMVLCVGAMSHAQYRDTSIFFFESDAVIKIANTQKIKENPVFPDTSAITPAMKYGISSVPVSPPLVLNPMKAAVLEGTPLKKLYPGLIKAGFGNYTTPLLDFSFGSLRSKTLNYGFRAMHHSSRATLENSGFSGFSDNLLSGHTKYFLRKHTLSGTAGYERNAVHYFGFNPELHDISNRELTFQAFNTFNLSGEIKSHYHDSSKLNHKVNLDYYIQNDLFDVMENNVKLKAEGGKEINHQFFGSRVYVNYLNDRMGVKDTANSTILGLEPFVKYTGKKIRASIGLNMALDLAAKNRFYFYPNLEVQFNIADYILVPYAGIGGGLNRNSYYSLRNDNPFLVPTVALNLRNTDEKFLVYGGLRGSISKSLSYDLSARYTLVNDLVLYATDTGNVLSPTLYQMLQNRFVVVYDSGNVLNLKGQIKFNSGKRFSFMMEGSYYRYSLKNHRFAWHLPGIELAFRAEYNLRDKIYLKSSVFYTGERFAPVRKTANNPDGYVILKGFADLNLGLEYRYNKRTSFFANFNNLSGGRYYRWHNYPVQRLNALGGATWAF